MCSSDLRQSSGAQDREPQADIGRHELRLTAGGEGDAGSGHDGVDRVVCAGRGEDLTGGGAAVDERDFHAARGGRQGDAVGGRRAGRNAIERRDERNGGGSGATGACGDVVLER